MIDFFKPVDTAWSRMEKRLFKPFDIGKWFILGFSAWLAALGEGSFSGLGNSNPFQQSGKNPELQKAFHELSAELIARGLSFWLVILALVCVVAIGLTLLVYWLGCRGQFMFLDNLLYDRAEVKKPWVEFRSHGNSLFVFCSGIGIVLLIVTFTVLALALVSFWPDLAAGKVRSFSAFLPWIVFCGFLFLGWLGLVICLFFMREFGVPMMYRENAPAWDIAKKIGKLGCSRPLDFLVYLFLRMVMAILFFFLTLIAGCLTCCIGFLPYLSSVLTLPLRTFRVGYTLGCLGQLTGENYWPQDETPPPVADPFSS